jgi:hypothetical protein
MLGRLLMAEHSVASCALLLFFCLQSDHGPGLAFIGLPWRVVPFPMFELQSKLCAR